MTKMEQDKSRLFFIFISKNPFQYFRFSPLLFPSKSMASNSSHDPNPEQNEDEEEEYDVDDDDDEEEEYDDDDDEDDEGFDPEEEALNAALAASLQEAEAEAEEDDEEYDDDDDDVEGFDPDDETLNAALAAAVAAAAEELPEVDILEAPQNQEEGDDEEKGKCRKIGSQSPDCTICLDPWTSDGPHRVCCIPCGHVYGKSCLEKWLGCPNSSGKCPQCNKKVKPKEIVNLYAPLVVVPNDDLEKEVCFLREDNGILVIENSWLREEIKKYEASNEQMQQLRDEIAAEKEARLMFERRVDTRFDELDRQHHKDRLRIIQRQEEDTRRMQEISVIMASGLFPRFPRSCWYNFESGDGRGS